MTYDYVLSSDNSFYPVSLDEIEEVEATLGLKIPKELREFYLTVGYGFIKGSEYNINRIMDPLSVRDFRLRENDFENYPDIEIFEEVEKGKLVFFEVDESTTILIQMGENERNQIYLFDMKIADSLEEFLGKILIDDLYYMDLLE